jgi:hypothetical protein
MFCANCGIQLSDERKFCPNCGVKVGVNMTHASPEQNAQPVNQYTAPQPPALETILLEGMASAWLFEPGQTFSQEKMDGKFQVTQTSVKFVPNRFLSIGMFGKKDTVEIPFSSIILLQKTKWRFFSPAIEVLASNGYTLKFAGYGKIHKAFDMIRELGGIK